MSETQETKLASKRLLITTRTNTRTHSFLYRVNKLLEKTSLEVRHVYVDTITCKVQFEVFISDAMIESEDWSVSQKCVEIIQEAFEEARKGSEQLELYWFDTNQFAIQNTNPELTEQ